jgi:hypothetical protein
MSTAPVFLDIEKTIHTTWHSGLLYQLSELEFSTSLIELIASFLTDRKFKASVEGECSTPREIVAGVPECSVLVPVLCSLYINHALVAPEAQLALFADNRCILVYATQKHERRAVCKLQRGLTAVKSRCER